MVDVTKQDETVVAEAADDRGDGSLDGESSATVRDRVSAARDRALHRYRGAPWPHNRSVPAAELRRRWSVHEGAADLLGEVERRSPNLRGPDRILRMSWTVADLAGHDRPSREDMALALSLRGGSLPWAA